MKKLVKLSDDYASLNAGAILALKQGWPQVRLDSVVLLIRIVVTHMKVGPELASLVLDDVDGNLEIKFGHDSWNSRYVNVALYLSSFLQD